MNINLHNDKPTTKKWNLSTEQSVLVNVQQAWWPQLRHKCITWRNGDSKSWIDHVYTDIKTMTDNSITGVGVSTGEWDHDSDHSMIGIRINFTKMVGRVRGMEPLYKPRQRIVMAGQKANKNQYMDIAAAREAKHSKKNEGIIAWANMVERINAGQRTASKADKEKIQQKNDRYMSKIVKELLAIEQDQKIAQNKYGGSQKRNSWSDVFSRRNGVYRLLVDLVKKSVKKKLRPKIKHIVQDLIKESKLLHLELREARLRSRGERADTTEPEDTPLEAQSQVEDEHEKMEARERGTEEKAT
jgi:hypothetical protein